MSPWSEIYPPSRVRIACGDVELRGMTPEHVPALLDLAVGGILAPGTSYPFITDWAMLPPDELRMNSARFYFSTWASMTPQRWHLMMVVYRHGEIAGAQDLIATDFPITRLAHTGSWLGLRHQGQGTGTLMRQMICAFAFDMLGATECRTEAYIDNRASQRVSEKTGYERFDVCPVNRVGQRADEVRFRLTPQYLIRPSEPVTFDGVAEFRRFIGLD